MEPFKLLIPILCLVGCCFAATGEEFMEDKRFSPRMKAFLRETAKLSTCGEAKQDKLKWYRCIRSDNKLESIEFENEHLSDAAPLPLLQVWGDYLCDNTTKTVQCYREFIDDLVNHCLANHSTTFNDSKLGPLESILSAVCNGSGHGMKPIAKDVFKCTKDNFEDYEKCYGNRSKTHVESLGRRIGFIPYVHEYNCRAVNVSEECVLNTIKDQCPSLNNDGAMSTVQEMFHGIRNTQTCLQIAQIPKKSFDERFLQQIELNFCRSDMHCPGINLKEIRNDFFFENIMESLTNLCSELPEATACGDKLGDQMTTCITSDFKHFGRKGFQPWLQVSRNVCGDLEGNIAQLLKPESLNCFRVNSQSMKNCGGDYARSLERMDMIAMQNLVYFDQENLGILKEFQKCIFSSLNVCNATLATKIKDGIQEMLNEIEAYTIDYE